ncbi:MFS transporter [Nonomuraea mangrovi]|uniref:MFS transporter n=1 Tax=Nonomuraea mangrovi TaxID=2316207 RepID=A0ABW4TDR4_9ACTN
MSDDSLTGRLGAPDSGPRAARAGVSRDVPVSAPPHERDVTRGGVPAVLLALMAGPMSFGIAGPTLVLPHAARELTLSVGALTWLVTAFGWAIAVGTPLLAGLQNRRGARMALLTATALVLLGAVLVMTASALPFLMAGSALQGLGTAGLTTIAMSLTGSPRAMGLVTASLATIGAAAPLIGDVVSDQLGWRAALALPVLSVACVPFVLRRRPVTPVSGRRFDLAGMVLLTAMVTALVFVPHSWQAAVGAAAVIGLLLALRLRARPDGFVPLAVVRAPAFLIAAGLAFLLAVVNFGLIYALPPLLTANAGWSSGQVGLAITWPLLFGGLVSYAVIAMTERSPFLVPAVLFVVLAGIATVTAALSVAPLALLSAQALASLAAASGQGVFANRARAAVPGGQEPAAIGLYNLAYLLGAAFGPAMTTLMLG